MVFAAMIFTDLDRSLEPVESWEWPGTDGLLRVGRMTGAEREKHAEFVRENPDAWMAVNVAFCTFDADGKPIFGHTKDDIAKISAQPSTVLERITLAAVRINALTEDSRRELRKNFASLGASESTSCSAETSESRDESSTESSIAKT